MLQAHRHRQGLRGALQAWQEHVQHKRKQRQLLLRAEACYVFMTLLRVLQQWRAHTTDKQMVRLRAARCGTLLTCLLSLCRSVVPIRLSHASAAGGESVQHFDQHGNLMLVMLLFYCHVCCRADQHWQRVVYQHVLETWQAKAAIGVAKWQSLAKALCFQKQQLLNKALQTWVEAVQHQQEVRAAADVAFQGVAHRLQLHSAATVLQAWLQAAQVQAHHRQLLAEATSARQQRTQQQVSVEQWMHLLGIGSSTGKNTVAAVWYRPVVQRA
jgi:hypothetical protein